MNILLTAFAVASLTTIPDTSSLPYLNPDLEKRQTLKIQLSNQLEVLLISDPEADLSSATMAVHTGSWNDPIEYPGMAHFCEHMLFMGSEKYPDENAFSSLLATFGGNSNAFTAEDRTVYMFSSRKEGFLTLLDHFAHFYIDPLFNTSSISRELHAVDQEFAKNIQNDGWRLFMIWKELGNPEHPNRMFSIGNSETLSQIPQEALKKWHQTHYGANRMRLAIYSSLPLNELQKSVEESFSTIPLAHPTEIDASQALSSPRQKGHITYVTPFQNIQAAILRWEIPPSLAQDSSQPAQTIAYALSRAQEHNLEEFLKSEGLIDHISITADSRGGQEHRFLQIYLALSEKGLDQLDTTLHHCFSALASLKESDIPAYLFEEKNTLAKLHYQYQTRQDAFSFAMSIGETLPDEPLSSYPRSQLIATPYNPETIAQTLSILTPQNLSLTLLAPPTRTKVPTDRTERWLGAEYAIRPLSTTSMDLWNRALPHPRIQIAKPNPFIPTSLSTAPLSSSSIPTLLSENEFGTLYYARCPEFRSSEISHIFHLYTPAIQPDTRSQVLTQLYIDHLTDQLNPILSAASSAGLSARFSLDRSHLQLQISGFSDKAPLLIEAILSHLNTAPPSQEQFQLYFARHEKSFINGGKQLAFRQAKELLDSLLTASNPTSHERLAALHSITFEDFSTFCAQIFQPIYIQALFSGNLSGQQALSSWLDTLHALGKSAYPKNRHPRLTALHLDETKGPHQISLTTEVQGNATLLLLDLGDFSFSARACQQILASAIQEAFFQELRTKQKTGYIAFSDIQELEKRLYHYFLVQSNSHQPEDLLYRFELFFETYLQNLSSHISQPRFETLRTSAIDSLKTRFRNLKAKSALWDLLAFQQEGDFNFLTKRIEALQSLTYSDFTATVKRFLSRENRKRLALLFNGQVPAPFTYTPLLPSRITEVADYLPQ